MRDYLRTLLLERSITANNVMTAAAGCEWQEAPAQRFKRIPKDVTTHIFCFLEGLDLATTRKNATSGTRQRRKPSSGSLYV